MNQVKKKVLESMLEHYRRSDPMREVVPTALTEKELKDFGAFQNNGAWVYNHAFKNGQDWGSRRYELIPRAE